MTSRERVFDVTSHLDELRSWPTDRLVAHHEALVREVRRVELEDLDVLRVLDERGRVEVSKGRDGESARTVREKVETARALESLPAIARGGRAGRAATTPGRNPVPRDDLRVSRGRAAASR